MKKKRNVVRRKHFSYATEQALHDEIGRVPSPLEAIP